MAMSLRVMSFNVRYGLANDGDNSWPQRKGKAADAVRSYGPDVLCIQEALRFQLDDLRGELPQYAEAGAGRDDGHQKGEYTAILYDQNKYDPGIEETFWFSDTPSVPGSATWGNYLSRICTSLELVERTSQAKFMVYNAHWDHESQPARLRSAGMLRTRVETVQADGLPVIVTGDFNVGERNAAFRQLLGTGPAALSDTLRAARWWAGPVGTFHNYSGSWFGPKIDAILVSPEWRVLGAGILRQRFQGGFPSDHFPITALISL